MIHLDTNYAIGLVENRSEVSSDFSHWLTQGVPLAMSTLAWSEFYCGPVSDSQVRDVFNILEGRLVPFERRDAELAARLYNQSGRKKGTMVDCFIAATAMNAKAALATRNRKDFAPLVQLGLRLAEPAA